MRDMHTNGEYKNLTKFDLNDGDTSALVVTNVAQWKKNVPDVYAAFEDCSSFCNSEKVYFGVDIRD